MRCISDELIQKYVDREVSAKTESYIQMHLANCIQCTKRVEERRSNSIRIKEWIHSLNEDEIQVPIFHKPENHKNVFYLYLKRFAYIASAACILLVLLVYHQRPTERVEFIYSYDIENEFNANLPLSEQKMVIEIMDSHGKLVNY